MLTDISQKIPKYYCENCKTKTGNKKDYERHLATAKHQNNTSVNKLLTNVNSPLTQISPNNICCDFICKNFMKYVWPRWFVITQYCDSPQKS